MKAYLVNHPGSRITEDQVLKYAFDSKADADIMRHIYIEHLGVNPNNLEISEVEVDEKKFADAKNRD